MRVDQGSQHAVVSLNACRRIAFHHRLLPGVGDCLTIAIRQRQIIQAGCPVVGCIQGHTPSGILTVCQKSNRQSCRPQSVAVVIVVPDFTDHRRRLHLVLYQ